MKKRHQWYMQDDKIIILPGRRLVAFKISLVIFVFIFIFNNTPVQQFLLTLEIFKAECLDSGSVIILLHVQKNSNSAEYIIKQMVPTDTLMFDDVWSLTSDVISMNLPPFRWTERGRKSQLESSCARCTYLLLVLYCGVYLRSRLLIFMHHKIK